MPDVRLAMVSVALNAPACGASESDAEAGRSSAARNHREADTIEGKETSVWGVELVVMALMVLINALFAAYEIALASVPIARLQLLFRENRPGAAAALSMKQAMEGSLAVIQLGVAHQSDEPPPRSTVLRLPDPVLGPMPNVKLNTGSAPDANCSSGSDGGSPEVGLATASPTIPKNNANSHAEIAEIFMKSSYNMVNNMLPWDS